PPSSQDERIRWLLWQMQRTPMATTLTTEQRIQLTQEYAGRLQDTELLRALAASLPGPEADAVRAAHPEIFEQRPIVPATPSEAIMGPGVPAPEPAFPTVAAVAHAPVQEIPAAELDVPARLDDDEPVTHGREMDPAVMLLYVGALMVVAAGVIYAAYNWADFTAWQKLGALAAATLAFIAAGLGFRRNNRLEPAADTFLSIGALLVPINAVAAWQVLEGAQARPELPLFFGALATAIVHGAFAIQPGGRLYDYGAVISAAIAAATLPAAIGADERWGAPLALAILAGFPVMAGPLARLNRPRLVVSVFGVPLIALAAFSGAIRDDGTRWVLPVTLAVATFALMRVPLFAPNARMF